MGLEDTSNGEAENIIIQNGRIGQGILPVRVIKAGQNMGSEKKTCYRKHRNTLDLYNSVQINSVG